MMQLRSSNVSTGGGDVGAAAACVGIDDDAAGTAHRGAHGDAGDFRPEAAAAMLDDRLVKVFALIAHATERQQQKRLHDAHESYACFLRCVSLS